MLSMKKTLQVTCAIISFDEKVLAVQRSKTMKLPLKWEFPDGKTEEWETEVDCIKREIFEELNISKMIITSIFLLNHRIIEDIFFDTFLINVYLKLKFQISDLIQTIKISNSIKK